MKVLREFRKTGQGAWAINPEHLKDMEEFYASSLVASLHAFEEIYQLAKTAADPDEMTDKMEALATSMEGMPDILNEITMRIWNEYLRNNR